MGNEVTEARQKEGVKEGMEEEHEAQEGDEGEGEGGVRPNESIERRYE